MDMRKKFLRLFGFFPLHAWCIYLKSECCVHFVPSPSPIVIMHERKRNELIDHWEFWHYSFRVDAVCVCVFRALFFTIPFSTCALYLMALVKVSSMPANCAFLSMSFCFFHPCAYFSARSVWMRARCISFSNEYSLIIQRRNGMEMKKKNQKQNELQSSTGQPVEESMIDANDERA